jgi:hypothetical protein
MNPRQVMGIDGVARNPRREALRVLRMMASDVRHMLSTWDQRQSAYDRDAPVTTDASINARRRPLHPEEKQENSAEAWDMLAGYMGRVARTAMEVGQFAEKMALRVRAGERW